MVIRISSRTRKSNSPRSAQMIVTCRISSSKHCEYNSSRMGQMPVSRACRCCSHLSRSSCKLMTSARVAGVLDTYCRLCILHFLFLILLAFGIARCADEDGRVVLHQGYLHCRV